MPLAQCLLQMLGKTGGIELGCIISDGARNVWRHECSGTMESLTRWAKYTWPADDLGAGPASGSWWRWPAAVIVAPCSMGTAGAIASGLALNLVQRVAQVALKERIPLVLVPRESPLSVIQLRNLLDLATSGAVIMPFSPGFYLRPETISAMLEQFCYRILDQVGINHADICWNPEREQDSASCR